MKLTETERKVFEGWKSEMPRIKIETHINFIRQSMKSTAYHEAGHAVANAFLGVIGSSHFQGLSIIPNHNYLGCITHSRVMPFVVPGDKPCKYDHVNGKRRMVFHLAGRMAQNKVDDDCQSLEEVLIEGWEDSLCESEEEWRRTTDEGKALEIAEMLSNKVWPPWRILSLVEKWTHELIEIPVAWDTVDELAKKLIDDGEILDFDVYGEMLGPIDFKWVEYPAWNKRFSLDFEKDLQEFSATE